MVTVLCFIIGLIPNASKTIYDTTPPEIFLVDGDISWRRGCPFVEPGFLTTDNLSGVQYSEVIGIVDADIVGVYELQYIAFDLAGNNRVVTRRVTVIEVVPICPWLAAVAIIALAWRRYATQLAS